MFEDKIQNQTITVFGKTFNSEEERRAYFREELRKKLPELKQMEGFPIGDDEDILNLSDPPYYTACPNPWLNDFIAEWEEQKKELKKKGKRSADFKVEVPFATDISEGKKNPIYGMHSYHTKVPHLAIMKYILHYTQPGDLIFDGVAGTGMTAIAAQFCEKPDDKTKYKIEQNFNELGLKNPNWGGRKAINGDLSTIASFIAYNYNLPIDVLDYKEKIDKILGDVEEETKWVYRTKHSNGDVCEINYTVWSEMLVCPNCSNNINFYEHAVNHNEGKIVKDFNCSNCHIELTKRNLTKNVKTLYDQKLERTIQQSDYRAVRINYTYKGESYYKQPDKDDLSVLSKINDYELKEWIPTELMMFKEGKWGDIFRSGYHLGISNVHHFFQKRTLFILAKIYEKIGQNHFLKFTFTASIMGLSKLQRYRPNSGFPNMILSGTLYLGSLQREWNVINWFRGKASALQKAKVKFQFNKNLYAIYTGSATDSNLKDNSIDYIFTDPPFGSNLMYSELNFIWESWLKVYTNNGNEAIENKDQGKSALEYQGLMAKIFEEYFRVLKPNKWMTVEFSNTKASIWNGIQTALQKAGFIIANVSALDKQQVSFKALTNPTSVQQDLVISCYKPSSEFDQNFKQHQNLDVSIWDFVEEHFHHLPVHLTVGNATTSIIERSPKILFDRLIAFYIQKGLPVPIDAGKFQQGLREHFIERDGMFFTNEQVQEYDSKKAAVPNFIQMNLFVTNEQDSIYWLRNILDKGTKPEQDLHPLWMKEVASNMRKGDLLPEMRTILEENFLKDDTGKWYVPDPENEADLEKLRNKRLLKLFDGYKEEALKPKGKLKEVRVEALRTGFKQCYQDKDFKTIVTIGDRIPNNLLMEDEVLLQFYDIASSRV